MALRDEILEQPDVLQRWLDTEMQEVSRIAELVMSRDVKYVFLAARGSSDHAGVFAQYLFGSRNRLPVALAAPSLFTMYPQSPRLRDALVIGISQSGQSPDIVSVITEGRRQGAVTLAITNDPHSPLAQAAELSLDVQAGPERAVAATKTYTGELLVLAALSTAMAGNRQADLEQLASLPGAVREALALEAQTQEIAARYSSLDRCIVLGRGYNYATAQEWALKLKELAYVFTDVYSTADFQHGPIAIVQPGFPVLAVAPEGAVLDDQLALLAKLRNEYEAEMVVISDSDQALSLAGPMGQLRLPPGLPEWLTPIAGIVPAQLFCYYLTRSKGLDTENPRMLHKVTLTE
ncbi:MAG TPA: SIS domain-containing protein [Chloroflexia bacterium]|nr:SIS domain-containing protein [Chloroflexia bacterium]